MPEILPQPATLLVKLHEKGSRHIELTLETFTIGRKADNTLAIEDPAVSGHHARIVKIQAVFFVEDLQHRFHKSIRSLDDFFKIFFYRRRNDH